MAEVIHSPPSPSSAPGDVARHRRNMSLLALLLALFRKSFWPPPRNEDDEDREKKRGRKIIEMEIGYPTNVRHVAHVTFDRFNGFLGLPLEFQPHLPSVPPSASATVFGVSAESMHLSFDSRGNSVPTILLLLQKRLYAQGGLEAEGIFRINAENGQEEYVRNQLSHGMLPDGIDVHCLAGLIKAWFRELPTGVLDFLSSEQVMQSQCEEDYSNLVKLLPSTEAALLDWAINLMADIVQNEHFNKMNSHNIAMVFAPNMTQMADPLTALMYAVQVMNFLKTLIEKAVREREDSVVQPCHFSDLEYSDDKSHHIPSQLFFKYNSTKNDEAYSSFISEEPVFDGDSQSDSTSIEGSFEDCETRTLVNSFINGEEGKVTGGNKICLRDLIGQTSVLDLTRELSNLSRINSITEKIEAWR